MSNAEFNATGVLLFDGPARITAVIEMLFAPFHLNAVGDDADDRRRIEMHIASTLSWERYLQQLAQALPEVVRLALSMRNEPSQCLHAIGGLFSTNLSAFAETIDLDAGVDIGDIVNLALRLHDGHNLIGFSLAGAWQGGNRHPGAFGGWASYRTPHYALNLSSA